MKKSFTLFFLLIPLFFSACKNESRPRFSISGEIKGMPPSVISIKEIGTQSSNIIDSVLSADDGQFTLSGCFDPQRLYSLKIGSGYQIIIFDNNQMQIKGEWDNLSELDIIGSPASASLQEYNKQYEVFAQQAISLGTHFNMIADKDGADSALFSIESDAQEINQEIISYTKNFADTTHSLPVAVYVISYIINTHEVVFLEQFIKRLERRFTEETNNYLLHNLETTVERLKDNSIAQKPGPEIGTFAPDFEVTTIDGETVTLKEFRGKYILLDFWASWCPPCRKENTNVVKAYQAFKSKGFTVVSFSLDNNTDKWKAAVKKDNLAWTHISDLQGWGSSIVLEYGVEAIPMNFLISPEGTILARNLRGDNLNNELQAVFNQSVSYSQISE